MKGRKHLIGLSMALALASVIVGCSSDSPESLSNKVRVPISPYKHDSSQPGKPPMGGVQSPNATGTKPSGATGN